MAADSRLNAGQAECRCFAPAIAIGVWAAIALTPIGRWLESTMAGHVLIEIPLLVAAGIALGARIETHLARLLRPCNGGGIPGVLIAAFALAFWMIPRWLDAALTDALLAMAKYVSLTCLVGMPLAWSWSRMHPIARGVVKVEFLAMLFRLGWLYLISPDRLCNNYLLDDQMRLGQGFLALGGALTIIWLVPVFFDLRPTMATKPTLLKKARCRKMPRSIRSCAAPRSPTSR